MLQLVWLRIPAQWRYCCRCCVRQNQVHELRLPKPVKLTINVQLNRFMRSHAKSDRNSKSHTLMTNGTCGRSELSDTLALVCTDKTSTKSAIPAPPMAPVIENPGLIY